MIRNGKKIALFMLLGVIGAFSLTLGARSVLLWQVKKDIEADVEVEGQLMMERASHATDQAIKVLNRLAQSNGLSCTADHRYLYSEATRSSPWVDTIGLVDRNGNLVCTDIGQSSRQAGLLPNFSANSPETTLSLSGEGADKIPSLLVARHVANGRRLVARVPGELIRIDPVRHELRPYRIAMLSMGAGNPWYILEPTDMQGEMVVKFHKFSSSLPFAVDISISEDALYAVTKDMRELVNAFGVFLGLVALLWGYYLGRYRPDEGDRILDAIDNGEFVPFMQPIVDLETGMITGCEVLARWHKPDGSSVPPHEFIPLAQNFRLTREVTCHIMEATRDILAPVAATGLDFHVSFNLFSHQLSDDTIVSDIREIFQDSLLTYNNLVFEVSDRVPLNEIGLANDVISQIQALGADIALDDVGSGHSGLHNLSTFGVNILKLDKLMVDSLNKGIGGKELVGGVVQLAGKLDIGVIAEGVETEQQVLLLRKMGVSAAQGYLFAPPLPASSFVDLFKASAKRVAPSAPKAEASDTDDQTEDAAA